MILVRAPFRIPLGGGGTDLPSYYSKFGGNLISVAIDKYMMVSANRPIVDRLIRLKYSKSETVDKLDQIQHPLARESLRMANVTDCVELAWMADVPYGTGLGSSGSFLVATLKSLYTLKGETVDTARVAEEACKIEMEILKSPVGKQDQFMAAYGGVVKMEIDKSGKVNVLRPNISDETLRDLESSLLLFYTGISRSSSKILTKQNSATKKGNSTVVDSMHFIKEIGQEIVRALEQGDIKRFGALMDAHWQHKRRLSGAVSSSEIDRWYQEGRYAGGIGGKIMGAGGGGFLLFCCPGDKSDLRKAMKREGLVEMFVRFDFDGVKVLASF